MPKNKKSVRRIAKKPTATGFIQSTTRETKSAGSSGKWRRGDLSYVGAHASAREPLADIMDAIATIFSSAAQLMRRPKSVAGASAAALSTIMRHPKDISLRDYGTQPDPGPVPNPPEGEHPNAYYGVGLDENGSVWFGPPADTSQQAWADISVWVSLSPYRSINQCYVGYSGGQAPPESSRVPG